MRQGPLNGSGPAPKQSCTGDYILDVKQNDWLRVQISVNRVNGGGQQYISHKRLVFLLLTF